MEYILYGLLGTAALSGVMGVSTYNRLMALDERCNTSFSDIDVLMKHRHSLLPGLIETVKGFAGHEMKMLQSVTVARAQALNANNIDARLEAETQLGQSINSLMNFVENYPDIKASAHFRELRNSLADVENRITAARRFYNLSVDEFNATRRQFPGIFIANATGLSTRKQFDLGTERIFVDEPVTVKF
ncbi:MAG: LemA family protein [Salaquimonas sp.]